MSKIGIFFGEGFEEIEALSVVDLCRRAQIETEMVSIANTESVMGSHGILVKMDKGIAQADFDSYDMLVLPGGMPGTKNLEACGKLMEKLDAFYAEGKWIAAICAAPGIFGHRGFLKGRRACCYPSFESHLEGAQVSREAVEIDGRVITSRGMGTAIRFGLAIVSVFQGNQAADILSKSIINQ